MKDLTGRSIYENTQRKGNLQVVRKQYSLQSNSEAIQSQIDNKRKYFNIEERKTDVVDHFFIKWNVIDSCLWTSINNVVTKQEMTLHFYIFYLMEVMYKEGEGRGIQKMRVCFIKVGTKNESTQS